MNPASGVLQISDKEKRILYELSLNARESLSSVASRLGLSRQVVSYSLESLEKKGIVEGYYAILNINRLGFLYHRIFLKFRNVDLPRETAIIEFCRRHKKIGWVIQHQGAWDLAVMVWAKNAIEFEEVLDDFMSRFGSCVEERLISISTTIHHLKHKFLLGKKSQKDLILGGEPNSLPLDETDYNILGILTKTARKTYMEIGEELSIPARVVKNRMEKLHQNRVILGYHVKLNHKLLGYSHIKVFLHLNYRSRDGVQRLITHLKNLPETIYITRAVGIADLEFELYVTSNEHFHNTVRHLRLAFPDLIRGYSSVIIRYEPYINYLPIKK
jgi:DNA-binding Lrp family transcriptional regulator